MNPASRNLEGVRLPAGCAGVPRFGEVTYTVVEYTVVEAPAPARRAREQRAGERRRTRLRTGKLADASRGFIIECIFHDRSSSGARLRLVKDVPLPMPLMVYDDETGILAPAKVVWRNRQDVGIRFEPRVPGANGGSSLGSQFYAMARSPRAR